MKEVQIIVRVTSIAQSYDLQGNENGYDVTVMLADKPLQMMHGAPYADPHRDHLHLSMKEAPSVGAYLCLTVNEATQEQANAANEQRLKRQVLGVAQGGTLQSSLYPPQVSTASQLENMGIDVLVESAHIEELKEHSLRIGKLKNKIDKKIKELTGEE